MFASPVWSAAASVFERLNARLLVTFDFDGTIAPVARHPQLVRVPERTRALLARAARLQSVEVAIVSARPMRDLKRHLAAPGVRRVAQYGLEGLERPDAGERRRIRRTAAAIRKLLARTIESYPGAWIEDKGLTLGVHYRALAPRRAAELLRSLRAVESEARKAAFAAERGQRVIDFVPSGYDKGRVLRALRRRTRPAATFYFGDSAGDESAFAVLGRADFPVRVGPGRTAAPYRIRGPGEVARFLQALVAHRTARPGR